MPSDRDIAANVAVIIAAYRAADTIGIAVRSALAEVEVAEVIVIDDCSPDQTVAAARAADDGSGRLVVVTQSDNGGPAIARNRGFDMATADYVAILDADDYFLPGRFTALFEAQDGWDLIADNIAFATGETDPRVVPITATTGSGRWLGVVEFIDQNISRPGKRRGEMGFLKPVIRRDFMERTKLRYDEQLRLGEDFALYVRALTVGGRFWISSGCGYVAIERSESLSGAHRTEDIASLVASDRRLLAQLDRTSPAAAMLHRHYQYNLKRYRYRAFLDVRKRMGVVRALGAYALRPVELTSVLASYARDKLKAFVRRRGEDAGRSERQSIRFLIET